MTRRDSNAELEREEFVSLVCLLPPLRGCFHLLAHHPRLAPWAASFRSFGAAASRGLAYRIPDLKIAPFDCDIHHRLRSCMTVRIEIGSRLYVLWKWPVEARTPSLSQKQPAAAEECSPRRKAWVGKWGEDQAPKGRKKNRGTGSALVAFRRTLPANAELCTESIVTIS